MKLSDQIRTLHAKGRTPEAIAKKLACDPKYVRRVIHTRKPGKGKGVADKARELAETLDYDQATTDEARDSIQRDIAAKLSCSLQEVELALSRPPTRGRPPAPCCEACGQPLRGEAAARHAQYIHRNDPSNHHIDNIEIRDAEEKTNG
jgi:hypothetical protein